MTTERIGPFRVIEEIGASSTARVVLALRAADPEAGQILVETLRGDREHLDRLEPRLLAARELDHHAIARVIEHGLEGDHIYVAYAWRDGLTLRELLRARKTIGGALPAAAVWAIARDLASALEHAHVRWAGGWPLLHGAISPGRVIVAPDGTAQLIGFGLVPAKRTAGESLRYSSPEQVRDEHADERSDLFTLGAVLFRAAVGREPFTGPTDLAVLRNIATGRRPPVAEAAPDLPRELAAIIEQLLAADPFVRFQSAADLVAHLSRLPERREERDALASAATSAMTRAGRAPVAAPVVTAPEPTLATVPATLSDIPLRTSETIPIQSEGPFVPFTMHWQLRPPQDALVVVVKCTLRIVPGGLAEPLEEQDPPVGDLPFDDEPDAIAYASDYAYFKPVADVTLIGHAYAPGRQTVQRVGFRFGDGFDRTLAVVGDRRWERGVPTAPEPFERMPLRWSRAYGGHGHAGNPVGRGHEAETGFRLPNLEDPLQLVQSPRDRPAPACFAPIPQEWVVRWGKLGTYDDRWLATRWPWFPEDFDFAFFNAAPPEQRVPYPRGDERFSLRGVRPDHPVVDGQLPGAVPRAFVQHVDGDFHEIVLRLDTVSFDADAMKVSLVWRGLLDVSTDHAPEIASLFVCDRRAIPDERLETAQQMLFAAWRGPTPEAEVDDEEADTEPPPPAPAMSREEIVLLLDGAVPLAGRDFTRCDLTGLDLSGRDLTDATLTGAVLDGAGLEGTTLTRANLAGASLREARMDGAILTASVLDDAKLDGAKLTNAKLNDASLARASLAGSILTGADLTRANLTSAIVDRARFDAAVLDDARLYEAKGEGALFDGASMKSVRADGATLRRCALRKIDAPSSTWLRADLAGSDLTLAVLREAVLTMASLDDAILDRVDAREAQLKKACLRRAKLRKANFMQARFEAADLREADARGANLYQCEVYRADTTALLLDPNTLTASTKLPVA